MLSKMFMGENNFSSNHSSIGASNGTSTGNSLDDAPPSLQNENISSQGSTNDTVFESNANDFFPTRNSSDPSTLRNAIPIPIPARPNLNNHLSFGNFRPTSIGLHNRFIHEDSSYCSTLIGSTPPSPEIVHSTPSSGIDQDTPPLEGEIFQMSDFDDSDVNDSNTTEVNNTNNHPIRPDLEYRQFISFSHDENNSGSPLSSNLFPIHPNFPDGSFDEYDPSDVQYDENGKNPGFVGNPPIIKDGIVIRLPSSHD